MKVYKFGGASVKNASAVKNMAGIIGKHGSEPLIVVISAMGKTTNALERLVEFYFQGTVETQKKLFEQIKNYHYQIIEELFADKKHDIYLTVDQIFYHLYYYLRESPGRNYNFEYDRIVSTGEILSTKIISAYLKFTGIENRWFDARQLIITDSNYRDATVDWLKTENLIQDKILQYLNKRKSKGLSAVGITQGFLGGTTQGFTTTLGREGSDYTAAIIAYALKAQEVVIWKDVAGVLNADPKLFKNTNLLRNISYQEAIELSYYGATVIHPKTLKPLLKKGIPLKVRSFYHPENEGSLINHETKDDNLLPSYIIKFNQVLLSVFPKDFSFIAEKNLSRIFSECAKNSIKINLMQNSALSFSICFDQDRIKTPNLLKSLRKIYTVKYNTNLQLITIRHYEKANLEQLLHGKNILIEQKNRTTLQWVVKESDRKLEGI
ncbi:MAG: aspartate kinase [Bacteroidota bacterium]